jgi:hypothetical protein
MKKDGSSIEKVLNSRCSSSFDIGAKKNHWGTFTDRSASKQVLETIIHCINVPRFSSGKLLHWFEDSHCFVGFEKPRDSSTERTLHVESGMQQQAIYLASTAQGVGTCIHNQGINGTEYGNKIATAKHLIMEIMDPYETGKFTAKAPGPKKPFKVSANLCEPSRDGDLECLPELEHLKRFNKSGSQAARKDISQLLWAAKGRTPHVIHMHVWNHFWGLTIPTWGGGQTYTSLYLVKDHELGRYLNWTTEFSPLNRLLLSHAKWTRGNPTHEIRFIRKVDFSNQLDDAESAIIMCQNEKSGRALWEVGYMLENIFLQAKSLGISYETKIFETEEVTALAKLGMTNAVAAVLL